MDNSDYDMLRTEFALLGNKLDLLNEYLSMIQKTTYQMLMEQVKTNACLEMLLEAEHRKINERHQHGESEA